VSRAALTLQADHDLATGSIVFVPPLGNQCRTNVIDNATWRIYSGSVVDCRTALSRHASPPLLRWSTARVDVIRHSFAGR
jgi:hypothetical protein